MLDKLLDRFEHRVSVESILQSVPPERKLSGTPSDQGSDPRASKKSESVESAKSSDVNPATQTNLSHRGSSSERRDERSDSQDSQPGKRGVSSRKSLEVDSPVQPLYKRQGTLDIPKVTSPPLLDRTVNEVSIGLTLREDPGTIAVSSTQGRDLNFPFKEHQSSDLGVEERQIGDSKAPFNVSDLNTPLKERQSSDAKVPFKEHHGASSSMFDMQVDTGETGLWYGRRNVSTGSATSKASRFFKSDSDRDTWKDNIPYNEMGVAKLRAGEVKGEISVCTDDRESGVSVRIANFKTEVKETVDKNMNRVIKDGETKDKDAATKKTSLSGVIGEGRSKKTSGAGVIGQGRAKKKTGTDVKNPAGGRRVKVEWGDASERNNGVSASVMEDEDFTHEHWDSSEEMDLLGDEDYKDEEKEAEKKRDKNAMEGGGEVTLVDEEGTKAHSDALPSQLSSVKASQGDSTDVWKPHLDLPLILSGKRVRLSKYSSTLQAALDATRHRNYQLEGEIDERRLISIRNQQLLVSKLMSEYKSICALAEDQLIPKNSAAVSLLSVLEMSRNNGYHGYLTDEVVEQMFKDRQLMPRVCPVSSSVLSADSGIQAERALAVRESSKKSSQLLSIVRASAMARKLEAGKPKVEQGAETSGDSFEDDPAIVQKIKLDDMPTTGLAKTRSVAIKAAKESLAIILGVRGGGEGDMKDDGSPLMEDPCVLKVSSSLKQNSQKYSDTDKSMDTSVCSTEDPLPNNNVFPSALPSDGIFGDQTGKLNGLFNPFSTSDFGVDVSTTSAKRATLHDEFLTPPQSPTPTTAATNKAPNTKNNGTGGSCDPMAYSDVLSVPGVVADGRGFLPAHGVRSDVSDVMVVADECHISVDVRSHDPDAKSHAKSRDSKLLSVQEQEQLLTSSEEAYFSADSEDNVLQCRSNDEIQFRSKAQHSRTLPAAKSRSVGVEINIGMGYNNATSSPLDDEDTPPSSSLPLLEPWAWNKDPTSLESWSPESHTSSLRDDHTHFTATPTITLLAPPPVSDVNTPTPSEEHDTQQEAKLQEVAAITSTDLSEVDDVTEDSFITEDSFEDDELSVVSSETDLAFLMECFPDLDYSYLERLLMKNSGNVEETVSMALLSTTNAATSLSPLHFNQVYFSHAFVSQTSTDSELSTSSGRDKTSCTSLEAALSMSGDGGGDVLDDTANDEEIARALQERLDEENSVAEGENHLKGSDNDEIVARALQKKLDHETDTGDGVLHLEGGGGDNEFDGDKETHGGGVHYLEGANRGDYYYDEDENLVLKLTPSLAHQLQTLFGSVQEHLPFQGNIHTSTVNFSPLHAAHA